MISLKIQVEINVSVASVFCTTETYSIIIDVLSGEHPGVCPAKPAFISSLQECVNASPPGFS